MVSIFLFSLGSGLLGLGAFLLLRLISNKSQKVVWGTVLPATMVAVSAAICHYGEMACGIIWGVVAFNFGLIGLFGLFGRKSSVSGNHLMNLLGMTLGIGACWISRRSGCIGVFGGCSLMIVGIIMLWQMFTMQINDGTDKLSLKQRWLIWHWTGAVCAILLLSVGAWLVVWRHAVVATILGFSEGLLGSLIIAPLCGICALFGLRSRKQWQVEKLLIGLKQTNVLLVTIGLGLVILLGGGLALSQSILLVALPWVVALVLLSVLILYLPQKTARWWGGLLFIMYLGYVVSLLG